jgi:hypothetical protein
MFMYRFVYINVCQCMLMHVDVGRSYMEHTGGSGLQRVAPGLSAHCLTAGVRRPVPQQQSG